MRTDRQRLVNYNTLKASQLPDVEDFDYGEIAVRYNTNNPEIIIKKADDSFVSFRPNTLKVYPTTTGTATAGSATTCNVTDSNVTAYGDTLTAVVKLNNTPDSEEGIVLQINSLGYKPILYADGTKVKDEYNTGDEILIVYNASLEGATGAWQVVNSQILETLATVARTGSYNDLAHKPTIPVVGNLSTTATTSLDTSTGETMQGDINLHKISKTGDYGDLVNKPELADVATSGEYDDLKNKPTIPAVGKLITTATGSQATSTGETMENDINLHKVSKTGDYGDLVNKPTIGNGQLTVTVNGENSSAFTANQTGDTVMDINVPTAMTQLTNDGNFVSDSAYTHTDNNFDNAYKGKLDGIASGAEVNVQSDWSETATTSDSFIKNKPTIPTVGNLSTTATTAMTPNTGETMEGDINLHKVSKTGSYSDLNDKPTIGNGVLTIQRNGTDVGSFSANQTSDVAVNITVPVSAEDVSALPSSTKYAAAISLSMDFSTYVMTLQLKDQDGSNIGTAATVDLPLESVVVSGSYDTANKKVVLTLKDGSTVDFSVADLISGLQSEITESNKLSADLVEDGTTNKVFTATEKTKLGNIADGAEVNVQSDWSETASTSDAFIKNKPTIGNGILNVKRNGTLVGSFSANQTTDLDVDINVPVSTSQLTNNSDYVSDSAYTHTDRNFTSGFQSKLEGIADNAEVNVQADWNETGTTSDAYIRNKPTIGDGVLTVKRNGSTVGSFSANQTTSMEMDINVPVSTSQLTNNSDYVSDSAYTHTDNNFDDAYKGKLDSIASGAQVNVQADWNETGTTSDAYIKNKPSLGKISSTATTELSTSTGESVTGNIALHKIAKTGKYSDLSGTPTIGNGTVSFKVNGSSTSSITMNQTGDTTVDIKVPTKTSEITNDSNFPVDANYVHTDNNFSAAYKGKLDGIASGAEVNVQADWSETNTASDAYIKNKPAPKLSTTATTSQATAASESMLSDIALHKIAKTGKYDDLIGTPTIPDAQVPSDWSQTSTGSVDYIKNKPNIHYYQSVTGTAGTVSNPTKYDITDAAVTAYTNDLNITARVSANGHAVNGSTLQINSLGYKPIMYPNGVLVYDELVTNTDLNLTYNTSMNSGNGAWVVVNGLDSIVTRPMSMPSDYSSDNELVLDSNTRGIYYNGNSYGPMATMSVTSTISSASTAQEIPNASVIWQLFRDYVSGATTGTSPSMVYAPEVVIDNTSTDVHLTLAKGNTVYIWNQPLTSLVIDSFEDSVYETTMYFTTDDTTQIETTFPQALKRTTSMNFTMGKHYVISVKDLICTADEIEMYVEQPGFIYDSEQWQTGVLEVPSVVQNANTDVVINNTQPNTIYKCGAINSLTMLGIPCNSLETTVYFTAGSTSVNLNLQAADSDIPLKITRGSMYLATKTDTSFAMSIKDGVITISVVESM